MNVVSANTKGKFSVVFASDLLFFLILNNFKFAIPLRKKLFD